LRELFVYLHIFSAILSIGPYFVLYPMLKKMKSAKFEELHYYLDSFKFVVWLTKHAGHLLVLSGVLLIWVGGWDWKTSWLLVSIIILMSALFFIARAFSPILRNLKEAHENRGELISKLGRALNLYLAIMLLVMWLMVAKPIFW
jgi:uncharacterized membrane protein